MKDFEQISLKPGFMKHNGGSCYLKLFLKKSMNLKQQLVKITLMQLALLHGGFIAALVDAGAGTAAHRVS